MRAPDRHHRGCHKRTNRNATGLRTWLFVLLCGLMLGAQLAAGVHEVGHLGSSQASADNWLGSASWQGDSGHGGHEGHGTHSVCKLCLGFASFGHAPLLSLWASLALPDGCRLHALPQHWQRLSLHAPWVGNRDPPAAAGQV